jgi:hypothetical protein
LLLRSAQLTSKDLWCLYEKLSVCITTVNFVPGLYVAVYQIHSLVWIWKAVDLSPKNVPLTMREFKGSTFGTKGVMSSGKLYQQKRKGLVISYESFLYMAGPTRLFSNFSAGYATRYD